MDIILVGISLAELGAGRIVEDFDLRAIIKEDLYRQIQKIVFDLEDVFFISDVRLPFGSYFCTALP